MFEDDGSRGTVGFSTDELATLLDRLAGLSTDVPDPARIDVIAAMEVVKAAAGAVQARFTAAFAESQRVQQEAAGVRYERIGQGIAAQVGLAKGESPARARDYTVRSRTLVTDLPATFAALQRGVTTEWRAMIVARETRWLTPEQRGVVDGELAGRLGSLGDRQVEAETKKIAYRLDPAGFVNRSRAAVKDRRVTLRPAPDTMARLTALLPVTQGVAAYAALIAAADTARAAGDPRGRGQVMADTMAERITGQATAAGVSVEVNLVMTDHTLLNAAGTPAGPGADNERAASADGARSGDEPAHLVGYGPIPAELARDLVLGTDDAKVWIRRLSTNPATGDLTAIDKRRRFKTNVRRAILLRDQTCRTPYCDAPIRHTDHALARADGGETTYTNGQGLCEACNYTKTTPGWTTTPGPGGTSESVIITTPTGHTYTSRPPALPGTPPTAQRAGPAPPATESQAA